MSWRIQCLIFRYAPLRFVVYACNYIEADYRVCTWLFFSQIWDL